MNVLFYKTFTINQTSTILPYLGLFLFCVLPIPWMEMGLLLPLLFCLLPLQFLFQQDRKDHWFSLLATLPLAPSLVVRERYLLAALTCFVFPTVMAIGHTLNSIPGVPDATVGAVLRLSAFLLVEHAAFLLLVFRWGPRRSALFFLLAVLAPILLIMALPVGFYEWAAPHALFFLLPALLFFLLSYLVAKHCYARRNW